MSHDHLRHRSKLSRLLILAMLFRFLPRILCSAVRHRRFLSARGIINGALPLDDILLHECDLPPADPDYLKILEEKLFIEKYGGGKVYTIRIAGTKRMRRLAVVLPLKIAKSKVIPIPCVVDTGAPGLIYLGSKPLELLYAMNLVKEIPSSEFQYLVNGVLCYKEREVTPVLASDVPHGHESLEVRGDVRCNILGLDPAVSLGVININ